MKFTTEEINAAFIDSLIRRCYMTRDRLVVINSGSYFARMENGKYTYRNARGYFEVKKDQDELLRIFTQLIAKYKNFEHNGQRCFWSNGKWYQ